MLLASGCEFPAIGAIFPSERRDNETGRNSKAQFENGRKAVHLLLSNLENLHRNNGEPGRDRTYDNLIKSQVLYQLS